jgi:3-carboxy-cis,cis-muconate cycloisomerase
VSALFDGVLARGPVPELVADPAWIRAMLAAEAALARAEADVGIAPAAAAEAIGAACGDASAFDPDALGREATGAGNPVVPLVRVLTNRVREAAGDEAAGWVHYGATSQDILDTAAVLVTRDALRAIEQDLRQAADLAAGLAAEHRDTLLAGRTLLQQALPTTFGLKAAGWLVALDDAAHAVHAAAASLPAQLGGAAGTLAALGTPGLDVVATYSRLLGLAEPVLPWHTSRLPLLQAALPVGVAAGVAGKAALDITLLAQTEVGEVTEVASGRGGSSTLPHKRNPVAAIAARAAAAQTPGLVASLLAAMPQEHERAAGAWHAEWRPLRELLVTGGTAVSWLAESLRTLQVDPTSMRANLDRTGGLLLAERISTALRPALGRLRAHDLVEEASRIALEDGRPLVDVLLEMPAVTEALGDDGVRKLLDPGEYIGSAGAMIDRALAQHAAGGPE